MGDFAVSRLPTGLPTIVRSYGVLFPRAKALHRALQASDIRLLHLRRNVLVHKSGKADEAYCLAAKDGTAPGQDIGVSAVEFARFATAVEAAGSQIGLTGAAQRPVAAPGDELPNPPV